MSSQRSLVEERFDAEVRAADAAPVDWWADLERLLVRSGRHVCRARLQRRSVPVLSRDRAQAVGGFRPAVPAAPDRPEARRWFRARVANGPGHRGPAVFRPGAVPPGNGFRRLVSREPFDWRGADPGHVSGRGRNDRARRRPHHASPSRGIAGVRLGPAAAACLPTPVEHRAPELTMMATVTTERRAQSPAATRTEQQPAPDAGTPGQPGALSRSLDSRAQARRSVEPAARPRARRPRRLPRHRAAGDLARCGRGARAPRSVRRTLSDGSSMRRRLASSCRRFPARARRSSPSSRPASIVSCRAGSIGATLERLSVRLARASRAAGRGEGVGSVDPAVERPVPAQPSRRQRTSGSSAALDIARQPGAPAPARRRCSCCIAALVKLTSPRPGLLPAGPRRREAKPFTMLKFRTMRVERRPRDPSAST